MERSSHGGLNIGIATIAIVRITRQKLSKAEASAALVAALKKITIQTAQATKAMRGLGIRIKEYEASG